MPDDERDRIREAQAYLTDFTQRRNLSVVVEHYEKMDELISGSVDPSERGSEAGARFDRSFNASNAVLRTCGYLTEALWNIAEGKPPPKNRRGENPLDRYKSLLRSAPFELELGERHWQTLRDAFEVRNCLLHGNGRLALMNEKSTASLKALMTRRQEGLQLRHDRLEVGRPFVLDVVAAARWLIHETSTARRSNRDEAEA
jgi:hypothetical protein